ncbi:MAG: HAD family hydrolase [Chloroflexi bacterium]|nr:HAD family hydrolase [Chloroflexota bacterium]
MSAFGAVVFDMYETLVRNSPALWVKTFDEICQAQGLPLTGQQLWNLWRPVDLAFREERYTAGYPFKTYEQAWWECFQRVFRDLGQGDADHAIRLSMRDQARREAYPEAREVVNGLYAADHLKIGLLSNADNVALTPLMKLHGLRFHSVVSSEKAGAYKPDARAFRLILKEVQVRAEECLYVGDSQHDDVQGARDVGMKAAWVNRHGVKLDPKYPAPDYQISDLRELLPIVGTRPNPRPLP